MGHRLLRHLFSGPLLCRDRDTTNPSNMIKHMGTLIVDEAPHIYPSHYIDTPSSVAPETEQTGPLA